MRDDETETMRILRLQGAKADLGLYVNRHWASQHSLTTLELAQVLVELAADIMRHFNFSKQQQRGEEL
jgi:hypothetical protein